MQVDVLGSSLRVAHASGLIGLGGRALNRLDWQIGLILDDAGASHRPVSSRASSKFVVI
jgi:hypothetical protein